MPSVIDIHLVVKNSAVSESSNYPVSTKRLSNPIAI
jgi:hypothetical protein